MRDADAALLHELRTRQRRHRGEDRDLIDAWYELSLRAVVAIAVLIGVPSVLAGDEFSTHALDEWRTHGADALGVGVAIVVAIAVVAGARGAPLSPQPADVQHLLLAPISRRQVLLPTATRQLRSFGLAGLLLGAGAGSAGAARMPAGPGAWIPAGAAFGLVVAVAAWAAALAGCTLRLSTVGARVVAVTVLVWAGIDLLLVTHTAPTTWIAGIALLPLSDASSGALALVGVAVVIAVGVGAALGLGGASLEPLTHRSRIVSQLRNAVAFGDMRSAVLLHRELALELPRRTPWLRLTHGKRWPVVWRGWRGLLRWPLVRVTRVIALAIGAALLTAGARDTPLLLGFAGVAAFVAALDLVEPFAQEFDHPTLTALRPLATSSLLLRSLITPLVAFAFMGIVIAVPATVAAPEFASSIVFTVIAIALAALAGAACNVALGPPPVYSGTALALAFPDAYGLVLVARQFFPPALAVAGLLPMFVAFQPTSADGAPILVAVGVVAAAIGAVLFACLRSPR